MPIKQAIKRAINAIGYDLVPHDDRDYLQLAENNAFDAIYESHDDELAIVNAELWRFTNYTGLTYGAQGWHPYVETLRQYAEENTEYDASILKQYYDRWQPSTAQEAFITFPSAPAPLSEYPPYGFVSPWHTVSVQERLESLKQNVWSENRDAGFPKLGIEDGFALQGPVTDQKGQIEFDRLLRTYRSIRDRGYELDSIHQLIEGFSLVHSNTGDYRIVVVHGNHRLAALTALGYERAPIRLVAPFAVRRHDASWWPQVKHGVWGEREAQRYFDSFFRASTEVRAWAEDRHLVY